MPISPLLYYDVATPLLLIVVLIHLLLSEPPPSARTSSLRLHSLWRPYNLHVSNSAITDPSYRFDLCRMYASLYLAPWRRRVLDLTIASETRSLMKPLIYKYLRFRLLLISKARRCCAATASVLVIPSAEYTIGVKEFLRSRQGWRYLSFLSFSAVARAFADV